MFRTQNPYRCNRNFYFIFGCVFLYWIYVWFVDSFMLRKETEMTKSLGQIKTKNIRWHTFVENAIKMGAEVDWWEDKRPLEDVQYVSFCGATFYSDGEVSISITNCPPQKMQKIMEALQ